jgi:NTE family protein
LKKFTYNYISFSYNYSFNSLDTKHFPGRGEILNISLSTSKLQSGSVRTESSKTVFNRNNPGEFSFGGFYTFRGNFRQYVPLTENLTVSIGADVLLISTADSVTSNNNFYLLGGIESMSNKRSIPLTGFHSNQIPVKKIAGISTGIDLKLIENFHMEALANICAAQEVWRKSGYSFLTGYSLGVGYMSKIGPLRFGVMYGNYNREKFFRNLKGYVSFGYKF